MQWPHFYGGEQVKSPHHHYVHTGWHSSEMSVGLWRKQSIQCARPLRTEGAIKKEEVCLQPARRLKTHL